MKEKISNNLLTNLFITFGIGILSFIVNKYFADYMGVETLGLMKLFTQMIAYLSLAELGIGSASAYALYKPLAEKNIERTDIIISTIDFFYKKITQIVLIIGILLSFSIPYFIKLDFYSKEIYVYWILYVINTALGYSFAKYTVLFTANQEYGYVRKVQGIGKILFQLVQIFILIKFKSFTIFIIIMILENLYNLYFYNRHYKNNYNFIKKVNVLDKSIIKDMRNLFWHKIGGLVVHNTDYIILSKFMSLSIVGIYSSYLMIYQIILTLINVITPVITPKIGRFTAKNTKEKIYEYWKELQVIYIFLSTIFIICTYSLIEPFVILWLGREFILPKLTIILILVNLFINLSKIITDTFKFSCGFFEDTYSPILESFINLVISLILVQKIGLDGVILGTLFSNIVVIVLLKPILVFKRCFNKNIFVYLKDSFVFLFLVIISIFLVNKILCLLNLNLSSTNSWILFIKESLMIGIITFIVVFLIFLFNKSFRKFIVENLR